MSESTSPSTLGNGDFPITMSKRMQEYAQLFDPPQKDLFSNQSFFLRTDKTTTEEIIKKEKRPNRRTLLENVQDDFHWQNIYDFHKTAKLPCLAIVACFDFSTPVSKHLRERFLDIARRYRDTWFYRLHIEYAPITAQNFKLTTFPTFIALIGGEPVDRVITDDAKDVLELVRSYRKQIVKLTDAETNKSPEKMNCVTSIKLSPRSLPIPPLSLPSLDEEIGKSQNMMLLSVYKLKNQENSSSTNNLNDTTAFLNEDNINVEDEAVDHDFHNIRDNESLFPEEQSVASKYRKAKKILKQKEKILKQLHAQILIQQQNTRPPHKNSTSPQLQLEMIARSNGANGFDSYPATPYSQNRNTLKKSRTNRRRSVGYQIPSLQAKEEDFESSSDIDSSNSAGTENAFGDPIQQTQMKNAGNPILESDRSSELYTNDVLSDLESIVTQSEWGGVDNYAAVLTSMSLNNPNPSIPYNPNVIDKTGLNVHNSLNPIESAAGHTTKSKLPVAAIANPEQNSIAMKKKLTKAQQAEVERRKRRRKKFLWELNVSSQQKLKMEPKNGQSETSLWNRSEADRSEDEYSIEMGENLEEIAEKERQEGEYKEARRKRNLFRIKLTVFLLLVTVAVGIPVILGIAVPGLIW